MYYRSLCHKSSDANGQRSRSLEAEDRFEGLAEASFSIPFNRVAFLVYKCRHVLKAPCTNFQLFIVSTYIAFTFIVTLYLDQFLLKLHDLLFVFSDSGRLTMQFVLNDCYSIRNICLPTVWKLSLFPMRTYITFNMSSSV